MHSHNESSVFLPSHTCHSFLFFLLFSLTQTSCPLVDRTDQLIHLDKLAQLELPSLQNSYTKHVSRSTFSFCSFPFLSFFPFPPSFPVHFVSPLIAFTCLRGALLLPLRRKKKTKKQKEKKILLLFPSESLFANLTLRKVQVNQILSLDLDFVTVLLATLILFFFFYLVVFFVILFLFYYFSPPRDIATDSMF